MSIRVEGVNEVIANLQNWSRRKKADLKNVADHEICPMLERYAKSHRPWTDRTGNARRGLFSRAEMTRDELIIRVAHTVYYGVYLERDGAGRYSILLPTIEQNRASMERILRRFWES